MKDALAGDLLKAVSRSFYLTVAWLPREMQQAVAVAYLLARSTDSVADADSAPVAQRHEALHRMAAAIANGDIAAADALALEFRTHSVAHPAEAELLARFGEALRAMLALPPQQIELIRSVLATIIQGQMWDLSFFEEHSSVLSDAQTRQYIYDVAGCVGQFWTRLGLLSMGERFCDPSAAALMEEAGVRYGCGLQLVNILRDRSSDAAHGRCYLCSDASVWADRAERYLRDGLDYSRRLRTYRLRFTGMLPALLGLKTLRALRRARPDSTHVKIPRRAVYASMLRALVAAF